MTAIKIDPYLNCDAGTMSPFEVQPSPLQYSMSANFRKKHAQHGECYVLDDGGETDLDLGNYERFIDINLTSKHRFGIRVPVLKLGLLQKNVWAGVRGNGWPDRRTREEWGCVGHACLRRGNL